MAYLLIPVSVSAKVVQAPTPVPSLQGVPFNQDAALEKGIHVHWALPDALTRAKTLGGGTNKQAVIFPGIPDLWLVTRFNQPPAANAPPARTWTAWVVNSRTQTVTALSKWAAPAAPDANSVFTMPEVLPTANGMFVDSLHPSGYPGWGVWQGSQKDFDVALTSAVYYPSARTRFGFYDDLSGLQGSGNVSYTVIGWYSGTSNDPLANSANREQQIEDWLLSYDHHYRIPRIGPLISAKAVAADLANWQPQIATAPAETSNVAAARAQIALTQVTERVASMQKIQAALGASAALNPGLVFFDPNPTAIVCHGSVMDVPVAPQLSAPPAIATSQIAVYPSIQRALATVTAAKVDPQSVDYTEMLLQDLDHQKETMSGIIDLPGAAQALTFQSVPGAGNYYAQIRIGISLLDVVLKDVAIAIASQSRLASGHWPLQALQGIAGPVAAPPKPGPADFTAFRTQARNAFNAAVAAAKAAGTPIDPNLVRVSDTRPKAQSLKLAPSINGSGSDGAGWWIDINSTAGEADNTDPLAQILISTFKVARVSVEMPTVNDLYYQPGPRWYRPWSPQVVINDAGRSYRFGEDGQYDPVNGTLICRRSQYIVYGIYASNGTLVQGTLLLANPAGITSVAGLPSDTLALLKEALLLDKGSAPAMSSGFAAGNVRQTAQNYFSAAVQGVYLYRLLSLSAQQLEQLGQIKLEGDMPSQVAITPWLGDPWDPLFLDTNYSYAYSKIDADWQLEEDHVEMTAKTAAATNPPAGQVEVFNDRSKVTPTIAKVLASALVTRRSLDPRGIPVLRQAAPAGLTANTFQTMEIVSSPLVHTQVSNQPGAGYVPFDEALLARGYRQRCGNLSLNKVSLVDVFGAARTWNAGNAAGPSTPLTPRLPFWGRLQFRLQSAADNSVEADSTHSAIGGILLPDFVDHSLEVFDGVGNGIGQLSCDRARFGGGPAVTLNVSFQPYPWVAQAKGLTPASNPLDAIDVNPANPLRQFVAGLVAQGTTMPAGAPVNQWFETGLTAMLRAIDTVRATLDPSYNTPDRKVSLMGEPILVMVAQVTVQSNSAADPAQVAAGPPLPQPPAIPPIQVRIGDITRPDDGVLGFFEPNDSPANSRFAPVSKDAADKAILNGLTFGVPAGDQNGVPVQHPFVKNQTNAIAVQADQPVNLIMLTDIRGGIYATCGVLPRKRISVPKDFLDASLQNMEPVIGVGPILTVNATVDVKPLVPPPQVHGYDANFVYSSPGAPDPFPTATLPPSPPIGDLPPTRVTLNEGWVRMQVHKDS